MPAKKYEKTMANDKFIGLCKVADEILNFELNSEDPTVFCYLNKYWKLKEKFTENSKHFIDAITLTLEQPTKKIRLIPILPQGDIATTRQLTVCYMKHVSNASEGDHALARSLFPLVFQNYSPDLEQEIGFRSKDHLEKAYVSTGLYDAINEKHKTQSAIASTAIEMPEQFQPELRDYQERTVRWLLKREREAHKETFPNMYYKLMAADGETAVYKHMLCLSFSREDKEVPMPEVLPPGGILADEMGLGKTVEVIALVLLNPRLKVNNAHIDEVFEEIDDEPLSKRLRQADDELFCICASKQNKRTVQCVLCKLWQHKKCVNWLDADEQSDSYMCPQCWTSVCQRRLVESGATFIVSPNAIRTQWVREIEKHTKPGLRVLCYEGMNAGQYINPMQLAKYDVVLTDYNILRVEIYHTELYQSDRQTRHKPRSLRATSPLLGVQWWRVCLDEAQMVESNTSKAAEMVRMLPAINRWAVTGTPIQNSLYDLEALMRFVGFDSCLTPKAAWDALITSYLLNLKPLPLVDLLQKCMWRTCKSKVNDELALPPQTEEVHRLFLSNVEMLHYRDEHTSCTSMFLANLEKYVSDSAGETPLAKVSPTLLRLVLLPLLKIRQCCTMPVVQKFTNNFQNGNVTQKQFMNPKELLDHLKGTNELKCKSCLRGWASSYNGIAAIHVIRKKPEEAIRQYKQVLRLAEDYKATISVDTLLQIHALHNIMEVKFNASTAVPASTLDSNGDDDDDTLEGYQRQLFALERKYLAASMQVMSSVRQAYQTNLTKCVRLQVNVSEKLIEFMTMLLRSCGHLELALLNKIDDECRAQGLGMAKMAEMRTVWGVLLVLDVWHKKVEKCWRKLCAGFEQLKFLTETAPEPDRFESVKAQVQSFVIRVSECHLSEILENDASDNALERERKEKKKKKNACELCKLRQLINEFECMFYAKELQKGAVDTLGTECDSFEVFLIKIIFMFLKSKRDFHQFQESFTKHWESLDVMQLICKRQIKFWIEIEFVVKAFDELDMCKMRLSATNNPDERSNFRVMSYELDALLSEQKANLAKSQLEFTRLIGRLKYLKHLESDISDITCPICQSDDDERYAVLECGHNVCCSCLNQIMLHTIKSKPECPVCRAESERVFYAMKKASSSDITGIHSSKITYIVNLIKKLRGAGDPANSTKIIIFSQWEPILKAISVALTQNEIRHCSKCTPRDIDAFKNPKRGMTCLLMPFVRGSKGLNLIEATHVFLVEPILTPSEELQAIGRVHRFGQTKPTTVHRFIVNDTIEENIFNFIGAVKQDGTSSPTHWQLESMTLQDLKNLFVLKETNEPH